MLLEGRVLMASPQLDEIITLEEERPKPRLWYPNVFSIFWFFTPGVNNSPDMDRDDDEDPGMCHFV